MTMKSTTIALLLVALLAVTAAAQTTTPQTTSAPAAQQPPAGNTAPQQEIVFGPQVSSDPDSAKFNEYRDFSDGLFLDRLRVAGGGGSRVFQLRGSHGGRDDQRFDLGFADLGKWRVDLLWDQLPHRISRNAM